MENCLFCDIRDQKIPAQRVYEDEKVIAFEDLQPQAPTHVLIIPRKHIATLNEIKPEDQELIGHLVMTAAKIAQERGHATTGWRTVFNCNRNAGQTVFHVHLHLLAGKNFGWPPG